MKKLVSIALSLIMLTLTLNGVVFAAETSVLNITPTATEDATHLKVNFENFTTANNLTEVFPAGYGVYWGTGGSKVHSVLPVSTDRGTSLEVRALVYTGKVSGVTPTEPMYLDGIDETRVPTRSELMYPGFYFNKKSNQITNSAAYFKSSLCFPDTNFDNSYMSVNNDCKPFAVSGVVGSEIKSFNEPTGLTFEKNVWYDIQGVIDRNTGYYAVSISNGKNTYKGTGFVPKYTPQNLYRLRYESIGRRPSNDYTKPTSFYVDDIQFGSVASIKAPLLTDYTFDESTVPTQFKTTGGTAKILNGELTVTGKADADTVTAMTLPVSKAKFTYKADVTVDDLNANRSFKAGTVELIKLGSNKKLYIGGNEIAGVLLEEGSYSVNVDFNQPTHTAQVTITNSSLLNTTQTVSLGAAATDFKTVDWQIAAAAETVTKLDNVKIIVDNEDFRINPITSVDNETFKVLDDVCVQFTNPVDISAFNSETVKINGGSVAISNISKIDDGTVKIAFEKEQNTDYVISFANVADIFGRTFSGSTTIHTERQDLIISDVRFTRGNSPLTLATPGTVTATFDAQANNGTSCEILYLVGLYKAGHLSDCKFDRVSIGAAKESHNLSITIPDDGYYVLKAFVWDSTTLKPYKDVAMLKAFTDEQKFALVKFDDMGSGNIDRFIKIADWAGANDIDMNFIYMVNHFDPDGKISCPPERVAKLKNLYDRPYMELTSHGYKGSTSFYGVSSLQEQMDDFDTITAVTEKQGIKITSMAPPNNDVNSDTVTVFNANPQYKALVIRGNESRLRSMGFFNPDNSFVTLWKSMDVEAGATGTTASLDTLKANWDKAMQKGYEYVILQAHPGTWKDGDANETAAYQFLLWLKSKGVKFVKATEYAEYLMSL